MTRKRKPQTQATIDVADTLRQVQNALASKDPEQIAAAESILSLLVLNLRHKQAMVPIEVRDYLDKITQDQ